MKEEIEIKIETENEKDKEINEETKDNDILKEPEYNTKIKIKQSQLYFYVPLVLSGFSYMCHNSLNYMIQIEPDYLLKLDNNLLNTKLDKNKTSINNTSKSLIMWILFINILSKSLGHLILNTKSLKNKIDTLIIISYSLSFFTNILFYFGNIETDLIFILHIVNAFTTGLFFVTLLRLNWSFLPLNEGLVSGIFTSFEYFGIVHLSLFYKVVEFKYLFVINDVYIILAFICIFFIRYKFKGFYLGKSSDLDYNLDQKEKNGDKSLEENLIKIKEDEKKEDIINEKNVKEEREEKEEKEEKIEQFETDNNKEEEENNVKNNERFNIFLQNLYADITSYRFILLIITYFLLLFSNYILSLIYLPFGIIFDIRMFFNSSNQLIFYIIIYFISSIFFGISFDLKMVRTLVIRLIFLSMMTIILFFPTKYFSYFLDVLSLLNALCLSGIKSIIYPLVYREFFNNEENYYLISTFLLVEIIIYILTPFILKLFIFDIADFIMIFITCIGMLFGGYYIMTKKLFPLIIIDTNGNYDLTTKKGQGLKQLHLQDELPPLSKE